MAKIEVGDVACDMVTGFFGIVVARTEWLNGCARLVAEWTETKAVRSRKREAAQ